MSVVLAFSSSGDDAFLRALSIVRQAAADLGAIKDGQSGALIQELRKGILGDCERASVRWKSGEYDGSSSRRRDQ